ncbi:MAG: hypothetical protein GF330_06965 [Candidatus Eisenbacteria bacterium]|nr:hypothetical protein [Candidatus Eisenbacteria bacterium]
MQAESANRPPPGGTEHTHFITEYLTLLVRWKRFAILLFVLITLFALFQALFVPPLYESQARILPVSDSSVLENRNLRQLSEFSSLIDFGAWGSDGKSTLLSLLDSDLLRARVAADLDLITRFGVEHPDSLIAVNLAARQLRDRISVSINKWDNIIIEAEGPDPQFPLDLLGSVLAELRAVQTEMSLTTAQRTRRFIERRMAEAEAAYRRAQAELTAFQNEHGMVAVEEQQRALVRLAAELETQLTLKRAELNAARSFFSGEHGRVRQLEAEIEALEEELNRRQRASDAHLAQQARTADAPPDTSRVPSGASAAPTAAEASRPSLGDLPELAARYVRLAMDVEIQQRLLTLLAEQYEQAKIREVREISSFEVVDPPRVPASAKRTRRGTLLAGMIIGALAALVFPLLLGSLDRYFPAPARHDAGQLLRRLVSLRRTGS